MWRPEEGYVNVSCKNPEAVESAVTEFLRSSKRVFGLTVHPSQYSLICRACKYGSVVPFIVAPAE